tara:strand:- start:191 stop:370 length:180 start_codon:yes stop_codon:yes gene_type:complete
MKVLMPDYSEPIFWVGMLIVAVYAYIGGRYLDARNKKHKEKLEQQERKRIIKKYNSEKI